MIRRFFGAAALAALAVLAACGPETPTNTASADALFTKTLPDLSGASHALARWPGPPLPVYVWATWCKPCLEEMPDLDELNQAFPDVAFVGIGIDSVPNMQAFVEKVPVNYTLLEARSSGLDLMSKMGNKAGGLPFTVMIEADGSIKRAIAGQIAPDDVRRTLETLR